MPITNFSFTFPDFLLLLGLQKNKCSEKSERKTSKLLWFMICQAKVYCKKKFTNSLHSCIHTLLGCNIFIPINIQNLFLHPLNLRLIVNCCLNRIYACWHLLSYAVIEPWDSEVKKEAWTSLLQNVRLRRDKPSQINLSTSLTTSKNGSETSKLAKIRKPAQTT